MVNAQTMTVSDWGCGRCGGVGSGTASAGVGGSSRRSRGYQRSRRGSRAAAVRVVAAAQATPAPIKPMTGSNTAVRPTTMALTMP